MLKILLQKLVLLYFLKSTTAAISSHGDYWREIDPNYDLSYLDPVDATHEDTAISCALVGQRRNVDAIGYQTSFQRCHLYNFDYVVKHDWTADLGLQVFLRNEELATGNCGKTPCWLCMVIIETPVTWAEAATVCNLHYGTLLDMTSFAMRRCVVMRLQYLRKPTSKRYWVGGQYDLTSAGWIWKRYGPVTSIHIGYFMNGEPDNPTTESCVLMVPGGNYTMKSADCTEKHEALCIQRFA